MDLKVYIRAEPSVDARRKALDELGPVTRRDLDGRWWGLADEWIDGATGLHADAAYFEATWMEDRIEAVLDRHEASLG